MPLESCKQKIKHKKISTMKKSKIIIEIVLSLALIFGLVIYGQWGLKKSKDKNYTIDLSEFRGRIINETNLNVSTVSVPMSEALKFGDKAILSYGADGIKIWSPDSVIPNLFLYAHRGGNGSDYYISISDKKLIVRENQVTTIVLSTIGLIVMTLITIYIISCAIRHAILYKKEISNKKGEK